MFVKLKLGEHERDAVFGDDFEYSAAVRQGPFASAAAAFGAFFEAVGAFEAARAYEKRRIEA